MKQGVEVKVGGQTFRIRSEHGADHVRQVAATVSEYLEEAKESMGDVAGSAYKVALLASLNLADELLEERQDRKEKDKRLEERSRALLGYLDDLSVHVGSTTNDEASA